MPSNNWKITIVGGGLVGASLACALAPYTKKYGITLTIIEPRDLKSVSNISPSTDARSSALSYGTQQIYEAIDIWDSLNNNASAIKQVHISDSQHFGFTKLIPPHKNIPALGYVIQNQIIGNALYQKMSNLAKKQQLTIISPGKVSRLIPTAHGIQIDVQGEKYSTTQTSHLTIIADGAKSNLLKQLGITQYTHPYHENAIVANISSTHPRPEIAYKKFIQHGAIALLPLKNSDHALIWTTSPHSADALYHMDTINFLNRLQYVFGYQLGQIKSVGQRYQYPIISSTAKEQIRPGVVLLGNAAHTLHPIAAQGFNLSLRDAIALTNTILDAIKNGYSPGTPSVLNAYFSQRQREQNQTIKLCNSLTNIFDDPRPHRIIARNIALSGLNEIPWLKNQLTLKTIGLV